MLALTFHNNVELRTDVPAPQPQRDEALLAVRLAGICRTDLEITRGYMDFAGVMGHEFVGVVQAGPPGWVGRRVVAEINCPCGRCERCQAGMGNHCEHRTVLGIDGRDGVFAERVAAPVGNLHAVPDSIPDEDAVFVEPLAAACRIAQQIDLRSDQHVIVLGDGRMGQLIVRVLAGRVGRMTMVGRHEGKLAVAAAAGVETVPAADFAATSQADVVIDATGSAAGFDLAMLAVRPQGTIVLKSTFAADSCMNLAPLVIDEVTVVGSRCGPFDEAIALLEAGAVDTGPLISRRFGLSQAPAALEAARSSDALKVLIDVAGG